jgi:hypothetical protein
LNFESDEDEENSNENSNTISSSPDGLDEHHQQSDESDSSNLGIDILNMVAY